MNDGTNYCRTPTPCDQMDFLLRVYFGTGDPTLLLAINRAYRDLSRTVHGIGKYPDAKSSAVKILINTVSRLAGNRDINTPATFDLWHRKTCESLCKTFETAGYENFTIGQAQKWVNMTLKYVYVFGEQRMPGYKALYEFCHVPIDNIVLEARAFKKLRTFNCAWSRITDYDEYIAFQKAVRSQFPNAAPLAVEFWAWQGKKID